MANNNFDIQSLPSKYRPLTPFGYFFRNLVYAIPVLGWIIALITALLGANVNAKKHARSYFIIYVVIAVVYLLFGTAILGMLGLSDLAAGY